MPHPLFIYGTLHPDRAPAEIAAIARLLKLLGRATIQGRLYNLGDYPGVILAPVADIDTIPGELFSLPEGSASEAILSRLDAYEDFRPADSANSLFIRQLTLAKRERGSEIPCWVYTYNRRISESRT